MKKIISFIFSICLAATLCFSPIEKTFAETFHDEHTSDTTTNVTNSDRGSTDRYVKGMTPMRARALVGVALGLIALVVGWMARKRATAGIGNKGRNGAIVALSLGAISVVLSVIHLSVTAGAVFGSGSGKAGAIFALALSLIGITFSVSALRKRTHG